MSTIEIVLLIGICVSPILALLILLSKKKRVKTKEKNKDIAEKQVDKKPEIKAVKDEQPKEKEPFKLSNQDFSNNELKSYVQNRSKSFTSPMRKQLPPELEGLSREYAPRRNVVKNNEDKSIAEQIQELSPELKALIVAGVLDKKDFD